MAFYDPVAPYYDIIHGRRKETLKYIKQLLRSYHPQAKTLLSLACGTGTVCKALSGRYQVTGLDISEGMLKAAKKKLPKADFIHQDMLQLELDQQFDLITCFFASLNHVLEFSDWEAFFSRVAGHLKPDGVFVFDVLTELCLYNLVLNSPIITRHGSFVSIGNITTIDNEEGTMWEVKGYRVTRREQELLFSTALRQVSFDAERIEQALRNVFSEVVVEDPEQGEVNERSELLYFVCS